MRIKVLFLLLFALINCLFLSGCLPQPPPTVVNKTTNNSQAFAAAIIGEYNSYLPVNRFGSPAEGAAEIIKVLDRFQNEHLDWVIDGHQILWRSDTTKLTPWCYHPSDESDANGRAFTFGIYVSHHCR